MSHLYTTRALVITLGIVLIYYGAIEDMDKTHQWVKGKMAMSEVLIIRYLQLITSRNFDELFWSGVSRCFPI